MESVKKKPVRTINYNTNKRITDQYYDHPGLLNFWIQLQSLVDAFPKIDLVLNIGDFNVIIGIGVAKNKHVIGIIDHGRLNNRGKRLTELCRDKNMAITYHSLPIQRMSKVDMDLVGWKKTVILLITPLSEGGGNISC